MNWWIDIYMVKKRHFPSTRNDVQKMRSIDMQQYYNSLQIYTHKNGTHCGWHFKRYNVTTTDNLFVRRRLNNSLPLSVCVWQALCMWYWHKQRKTTSTSKYIILFSLNGNKIECCYYRAKANSLASGIWQQVESVVSETSKASERNRSSFV